jgi:hypothetical protein
LSQPNAAYCFPSLKEASSGRLLHMYCCLAEFQYPARWLADQTLLYRAAQRAEAARSLDPPSLRRQRRDVVEPSAAFGPAGSTGEENISVVVAPIYQGFKLESLGAADAAGRYFLDNIVAPAGSDKTATLIAAQER